MKNLGVKGTGGEWLYFFSNKILIIYTNWIVTEKRAIIRVRWLWQSSIDSSCLRPRRKKKSWPYQIQGKSSNEYIKDELFSSQFVEFNL